MSPRGPSSAKAGGRLADIPLNLASKSYTKPTQIGSSNATYSIGVIIMTILLSVEITRRKIWSHQRTVAVTPPDRGLWNILALSPRLPSQFG